MPLFARRLREHHREVCADFNCGSADHHVPINRWIREWIWEPRHATHRDKTILGFEAEAEAEADASELAGYGTWEHVEADTPRGPEKQIEIAWFALDERFQGRKTPAGRSYAGQLYATLEDAARSHPDSTPEMPLTLECHVENDRGLKFWQNRGYEFQEDVVVAALNEPVRPYHRMVR